MNSKHRHHVVTTSVGLALVAACLTGCTATAAPDPTAAADPSTPVPTASAVATDAAAAPSSTPSTTSAYRMDDPSTWTITGDEVGPIALGGRTDAETDDLQAAYTLSDGECPAAPETQFWTNERNPGLIVTTRDGDVSGVAVGNFEPDAVTVNSPTTEAGAGVGTSVQELQTRYPDLSYLGTYGEERAAFSLWGIDDHGSHITFELGEDGVHVGMVWVSEQPQPPYEFCG